MQESCCLHKYLRLLSNISANKGMGIISIVLISSLQENTQNSSFKVLDWNPERFGFPSFEESKSYKDILFPIN